MKSDFYTLPLVPSYHTILKRRSTQQKFCRNETLLFLMDSHFLNSLTNSDKIIESSLLSPERSRPFHPYLIYPSKLFINYPFNRCELPTNTPSSISIEGSSDPLTMYHHRRLCFMSLPVKIHPRSVLDSGVLIMKLYLQDVLLGILILTVHVIP